MKDTSPWEEVLLYFSFYSQGKVKDKNFFTMTLSTTLSPFKVIQ